MSKIINKMTYADKRELLQKKLPSGWIVDMEDSFFYAEVWDSTQESYDTFKYPYVMNGVDASIDLESKVKVARTTTYEPKKDDRPVTKSFLLSTLQKLFSSQVSNPLVPAIKQFNEEEMVAIEPLYCSVGEVDGHNEYIPTMEDMRSFVDEINKANDSGILQSSISHIHKTKTFKMNRAWVNECECTIGDTVIPKGMPLAEMQFLSEKAWEKRKAGVLLGLSVGGMAVVTEVEDV